MTDTSWDINRYVDSHPLNWINAFDLPASKIREVSFCKELEDLMLITKPTKYISHGKILAQNPIPVWYQDSILIDYYNSRSTRLHWQHNLFISAILQDCIRFQGLHQLLDFNILRVGKSLAIALFTDFCPFEYQKYKLTMVELNNNNLHNFDSLTDGEVDSLVEYTQDRLIHLRLINELLSDNSHNYRSDCRLNYNDFCYKMFYKYEYPYPYM